MTEFASRHFISGDRPLRRDIRLLGWLLRRLMQRHGQSSLWNTLHELRELAEARPPDPRHGAEAITEMIARLGSDELAGLTRAIGLFFDLANLAEDRHRVRVLRQRRVEDRSSETITQAVSSLRAGGMSTDQIKRLIQALSIEPVFTAHPTEARRRTVRRTLRRLRRDLYQLDRTDLARHERRQQLARMNRDLAALWYTDPVSARKPTVLEELDRNIFAVRTFWRTAPKVLQALRDAVDDPSVNPCHDAPTLQLGNWVGGDRDGNPYVTASVTHQTLRRLRATAIRWHRQECRRVKARLTLSAEQCPPPTSLLSRLKQAAERWPKLQRRLELLHPDEWCVHWLTMIDYRLKRSRQLPMDRPDPAAYSRCDELCADVQQLSDALVHSGLDELPRGALGRWQDRIRVFGLHLMRVDTRVNSKALREAIEDILRAARAKRPQDAQNQSAQASIFAQWPVADLPAFDIEQLSESTADLMHLFELLQNLHRAGAGDALGPIIVSMTHSPEDLLGVLWLCDLAARRSGRPPVSIPTVPLFETIEDLDHACDILRRLLSMDVYRRHLEQWPQGQMCMLGYSDSAKDGGYLASNWALFNTQQQLARVALEQEVPMIIFHGRGGAIGRGGGPAARAILSLPPESVRGKIRITEQGEVIAERYDDPAIARRHLEQLCWAMLMISDRQYTGCSDQAEAFARRLAERSMRAYRRFIESPNFERYLRQATVLPLIERLPIGSRPSRRTQAASLEHLRAIPFTFAWNQVRLPINAFFGLGSAYMSLDESDKRLAAKLYGAWPWFAAVIDNAELALARCDPSIACHYADLPDDSTSTLEIWRQLQTEFESSRQAVLQIKQEQAICDTIPWLKRALRIRNPYVDLLNFIQVELMRRMQRGGDQHDDDDLESALRLTIQSLAAGLRNTG